MSVLDDLTLRSFEAEKAAVAKRRLICEAMSAGHSSREVAKAAQMSHQGVIRIWKRSVQ